MKKLLLIMEVSQKQAYIFKNKELKKNIDASYTIDEITSSGYFKKYFPVIGEEHLKTLPKGFPKDFPYPEYIKCKDYTVAYSIPDSFFDDPCFIDKCIFSCICFQFCPIYILNFFIYFH